jgi:hypothetical protein
MSLEGPWITGVMLKLERAEEHLDTLDARIGEYLVGKPYTSIREYDPQHDTRPAGIRITKQPPTSLALVIGDYLHNLRSGLDHLAWQLVIASGGQPSTRTEFPIYKDSAVYQRGTGGVVIYPFLAPDVGTFIESLQPYHRGEDAVLHPLWVLHELSNIDKHRTLHIASMWISRGERFTLGQRAGTDEIVFFFRGNPGQSEMDVEIQSALSITLTEPTHFMSMPVVGLLQQSLRFVRETIIPGLAPFFDEAGSPL